MLAEIPEGLDALDNLELLNFGSTNFELPKTIGILYLKDLSTMKLPLSDGFYISKDEDYYKMFVKEEEWFKPFMQGEGEFFNKPRQEFSNVFNPNGYVDIIRTSYVKKTNRLHGNHILAFITEKVIELDTEEDLKELGKII